MGRKKGENSPKNYFDKPEEEAVIEYLYGDPANRDKIFKEKLHKPFVKMVESLIKRYKYMREDISIEDLTNETISHVVNKFDKFKPETGNKAYSYYGTVAVNYLKGQLLKYSINKNRNISYEDISSDLEGDVRYTYEMDFDKKIETFDFIQIIIKELEKELATNLKLKENDRKVGLSVIDLLNNWEEFFIKNNSDEPSEMLKRNVILYYIRETSFLTHNEVRNSLKKFKVFYNLLKRDTYG